MGQKNSTDNKYIYNTINRETSGLITKVDINNLDKLLYGFDGNITMFYSLNGSESIPNSEKEDDDIYVHIINKVNENKK